MERSFEALAETEPHGEAMTAVPITLRRAAPSPHRYFGFLLLAALVIGADQWSKFWLRSNLAAGDTRPIVPGWIHFSHVQNHGAAWSMLSGQRLFLVGITMAVIFIVGRLAPEILQRGILASAGLGLILGGAIGNLIDRILFASVTDFIDLDTPITWLRDFPVFNLADSALTVGVVLMLIVFMFGKAPGTEQPATS